MTEVAPELAAMLQTAYRYALALTHDEALADDVLQEACLSLLKARAGWSQAYLLTAVRTRFIDHCRAAGRDAEAGPKLRLHDGGNERSPVEQADRRAVLHDALGRLRSEEREVLFLHAAAGYSAGSIGVMTGQPRSTVLTLLQRGQRKLSEMLRRDAAEVCHG